MKTTFATARGRALLCAGASFAALALSTPAFAQNAEDDGTVTPDCADVDNDGECDPSADAGAGATSSGLIIVSGTRIARPNLDSPVPVTSVEASEILDDGAI